MSRILLLIPEMHATGGTERMVAALADLLADRHDVHVAAFDAPGSTPRYRFDAPFHALGAAPSRPVWRRWQTYRAQARALAALKARLGIELTISNLWRADLISVLSGGVDRKMALAHINVVGNPTNAAMLRARPLVAAIYRRVDRLVAVSEALAHELAALYRLPPGRAVAIENFVAPFTGVPMRVAGRQRLVWAGRMVREKNVPALVEIFAALRRQRPDLQLVLAGEGPELDAVRTLAAARALATGGDPADATADLILTGRLDDPAPVLAGAYLLLLPSRAEGLPMVLLEALAAGVPVAAADCPSGGVHRALGAKTPHDPLRTDAERLESGVLLPIPGNAAGQATWVSELAALLGDPLRMAAASAASRALGDRFGPEPARARWEALIAEVLA